MRLSWWSLMLLLQLCMLMAPAYAQTESADQPVMVSLPEPVLDGAVSLERAIAGRRSVRSYSSEALSLAELSQLLWAAQGITGGDKRHRSAPSAGALHPLEVYVVAANITDLASGVYHYLPADHALELVVVGDQRAAVCAAALNQQALSKAPAVLSIAAVYSRTSAKYGDRASRYVPMDAGHAAQNVLLQAVALGLGAVPMGAFNDEQLKSALKLDSDVEPLYLIPVGHISE